MQLLSTFYVPITNYVFLTNKHHVRSVSYILNKTDFNNENPFLNIPYAN